MKRLGVLVAVVALGAGACQSVAAPPPAAGPPLSSREAVEPVTGSLSGLPLSFIPNRGQVGSSVQYYVQGSGASVGFDTGGVTWALGQELIQTRFVGTPGAEPEGLRRAEGVVSYFTGDPEEWRTGLPTFERVAYRDLWPGIDLVYSGDSAEVKYAFRVAPGADPSDIRLAYRGADAVSLNESGQLEVSAGAELLTDDAPVSWQPGPDGRTPVPTTYDLRGATYGFDLEGHDPTRPLVIDPAVLVRAGYIGGSGFDYGLGIAVDGSGAAYVTGRTSSAEATFPETGGPDTAHSGGFDAFVAKVNPSGTALDYAGYIGGSASDVGNGIAVDASGAAYVTGETTSTEATFPVTGGPDTAQNGDIDGFVAKVNPSGTALDYAGYIGGSGSDSGRGIAVDGSGAAYVIGLTSSTDVTFPETGGPGLTNSGGPFDAFVAKVDPTGAALDYAGYIGGSGEDRGNGIAVDGSGAAYVTGRTNSTQATFPEAGGPDLIHNGGNDAFVAKVNPSGTVLDYAGYIGGSGNDTGWGIAVDGSGAAYVGGETASTEATFPVAGGPDLIHNGGNDAFVAKVNPSGTVLDYAGYIGGSVDEGGNGIAVDGSGAAHVTGQTDSNEASFPVTGGPDLTHNGGTYDVFVAKVAEVDDVVVPVAKSVTLRGKKKVRKGKKVKLTAVVTPCPGHEGDTVDLYRKGKKIRSAATDATCTAKFKVKMKKTARFQAVSPQQDDDHLEGTSNKRRVKVKKRRR